MTLKLFTSHFTIKTNIYYVSYVATMQPDMFITILDILQCYVSKTLMFEARSCM